MKEPKDKRTKAYKKWKAKFDKEQASKPKGLGDVVDKITEVTGIKAVVKAVAGEDCGCDERREKWNKKYKFRYANCLTEEQFNYMTAFLETKTHKVTRQEQKAILDIYNYVFNSKRVLSSCSKCVADMIKKLEVIMSM